MRTTTVKCEPFFYGIFFKKKHVHNKFDARLLRCFKNILQCGGFDPATSALVAIITFRSTDPLGFLDKLKAKHKRKKSSFASTQF